MTTTHFTAWCAGITAIAIPSSQTYIYIFRSGFFFLLLVLVLFVIVIRGRGHVAIVACGDRFTSIAARIIIVHSEHSS